MQIVKILKEVKTLKTLERCYKASLSSTDSDALLTDKPIAN